MNEKLRASWAARRSQPKPSKLYPVLWQFAVERQRVYLRRLAGEPPPWTDDPVLSAYRFTNAFRAADRVSQYLIRMAHEDPFASDETLFLRTLLFKIFNRIDTWEHIVDRLGPPVAFRFDYDACADLLSDRLRAGTPVYSAAYIMPSGGKRTGRGGPKHRMHLHLVRDMVTYGLPQRLTQTKSLEDAYQMLIGWRTLGPFLAFQYAIDLNYTPLMSHSETDFVAAGPGARDGLWKCFDSIGDYTLAEAILWLTDRQEEEFKRYGLRFDGLWGRPLQPIDVQNLLCEVSKYTRVSHPEIEGRSGRTRIKQRFKPVGPLLKPFFPPKWGLSRRIDDWFIDLGATRPSLPVAQQHLPLSRSDSASRSGDSV